MLVHLLELFTAAACTADRRALLQTHLMHQQQDICSYLVQLSTDLLLLAQVKGKYFQTDL